MVLFWASPIVYSWRLVTDVLQGELARGALPGQPADPRRPRLPARHAGSRAPTSRFPADLAAPAGHRAGSSAFAPALVQPAGVRPAPGQLRAGAVIGVHDPDVIARRATSPSASSSARTSRSRSGSSTSAALGGHTRGLLGAARRRPRRSRPARPSASSGPTARARARCSSSIGGIIQPTTGHRACAAGGSPRCSSSGAGFHPDLTGRENVYLNAVDPRA